MPQWRKLHVKTIDSVDVNEMPDDFTRLLWVLLPLVLDSKGRGIDDCVWLRSKIFPMRQDVSAERVGRAMEWMVNRGMVNRYEVAGRYYIEVPTFAKYQGNTEREAASVIPDPVKQPQRKAREKVTTNSRPTHDLGPSWSSLDVDADVDATSGADAPSAPPKKPDPVKELAAVFTDVLKIPISNTPEKSQFTKWWQPLKGMVALAGDGAPDLMRAAVRKMQGDGLTINAPISVSAVFTSLYSQRVAVPATTFIEYTP